MSDESDGNGDDFVSHREFTEFKEGQSDLCKAYRSHLEDMIGEEGKSTRLAIGLASSVTTIILGILYWGISNGVFG